jgi:flagellar basal-body rod modification protein FlgD
MHGLQLMSTRTPPPVQAMDTSGAGTQDTSNSTDTDDITGADFLTLLVSELKNQDPTQPTDPTTYVQQLVGVNSLEQLIQINSDLGGDPSGSGSSGSSSGGSSGG